MPRILALTHYQILWIACRPAVDVVERGRGNGVQRLAGKEGLVGSDDHVGESQQAGQHIVLQRQVGAVLEEQLGFFFVDVQAQVAKLAAFQRVDQCRVSTSAPRPVLISMAPGCSWARLCALIRCRVCSVSGQCRLMIRASRSSSGKVR